MDNESDINLSQSIMEVKNRIKDKVYNLVDVGNRKSSVWKVFRRIQDQEGNFIDGFVCCNVCKNVLKYLRRNGNSNLSRHKCFKLHVNNPNTNSMLNFVSGAKKVTMPENMKLSLNDSCVAFIVRDIRPMYALQGSGLADLLSIFTLIGLKFGFLAPEHCSDLLPHPTTITRKIIKMADNVIPFLTDLMSPIYKNIGGGITIDIWTDNFKKRSYMSLTTHFTDENFNLHDRILATYFLPGDLPKTGVNLKSEIFKILRQFKIFEALSKYPKRVVFVTDRGSNLICGLKDNERLNCFAHLLNNLTKASCEVINGNGDILDICRGIISYIKRIGLNDFEHGALKMAIETRWNSNYDMLLSISKNWDQVMELLEKRNAMEKLNDLQKESVDEVIEFLKPMKEATVDAEASKRPTLYLVHLYIDVISKHLAVKATDSAVIVQMKESAESYFQAHLATCISNYHENALYLHPMFKSLRTVTINQKENIKENVSIKTRRLSVVYSFLHAFICEPFDVFADKKCVNQLELRAKRNSRIYRGGIPTSEFGTISIANNGM